MRRVPVLVLFALCGCAVSYSRMAPPDRALAAQDAVALNGGQRYLRVSCFVTPFFRDATKKFLTPLPPDEVVLLNDPAGRPVSPGKVEKILPAGTRVRLLAVRFPSTFNFTEVAFTPRQFPWAEVSVEGEDPGEVFVVVLETSTDSRPQFVVDLERFLSPHDPRQIAARWTDEVREAIRTKTVVPEMPPEAVEMALGYPETVRIAFEGQVKREVWIYPTGKREAILTDGKLIRVDQKRPR